MADERIMAKTLATANVVHKERYRWACGGLAGKSVLDAACGCGYGSYMLAQAGAKSVVGVDYSEEAIQFAKQYYSHECIEYYKANIEEHLPEGDFEHIVILETIEHLKRPAAFLKCLVENYAGAEIVLSAPIIRTTHFNEFHLHDFDGKTGFLEFLHPFMQITAVKPQGPHCLLVRGTLYGH